MNYSRGFTLYELMIVLALAGLILGLGAPSFNEFRRNNRLTGTGNDFLGALLMARTEAIKRQQPVSLCASDNASAAAATCSDGAFNGWIVFEDLNGSCTRDGGEMLLRGQGPIEKQLKPKATGSCVPFAATGFVTPRAGDPADGVQRVLFCDERGIAAQTGTTQSAARGLMVTRTGRARITRDITSGTDTDVTRWAIGCP